MLVLPMHAKSSADTVMKKVFDSMPCPGIARQCEGDGGM